MHCPFCQHADTKVIDSRASEDGATIRRRRVCEACGERFSTLETIELKMPTIVKSDGRREAFELAKLQLSFERALHKRPVPKECVDSAVRVVVRKLRLDGAREVASQQVGQWAMEQLRRLDHVAYVRFASVYRSFKDAADFRLEIEQLEHAEREQPSARLPLPLPSGEVLPFQRKVGRKKPRR